MAEWNLLPHEEAKLLNIARDEALIAHADHAYLPNTPALAALFEPHEWVREAMRRAYSLGRQAGAHRARDRRRLWTAARSERQPDRRSADTGGQTMIYATLLGLMARALAIYFGAATIADAILGAKP